MFVKNIQAGIIDGTSFTGLNGYKIILNQNIDPDKSVVLIRGSNTITSGTASYEFFEDVSLRTINSITIKAATNAAIILRCSWQVIEFA